GLSLREARAAVLEASKSTGWFQAPQNVAFTILGWYYGDGDFGKSICAAVNCGDDTDCTGATLGSLWGILHGSEGIPERWRKPVGEGIQNVAISGFKAPATLAELTARTVAMAHRVLRERNQPVRITSGASTSIKPAARTRLVDSKTARELWARSPYRITYRAAGLEAVLDYGRDPEVEADTPRALTLRLTNAASTRRSLRVQWTAGSPLSCSAAPKTLSLAQGASGSLRGDVTLARETRTPARGSIRVSEGSKLLLEVPFAFLSGSGVRKGDLALARLGATATCDSELNSEPGCVAKAIDGEVVEGGAFEGRRWHSALTPHPHWLAVALPKASTVSRAIVHFADPAGHPVDFDVQASDDGAAWRTVSEQRGYQSQDFAELQFSATTARHFRLVIHRSASAAYPNAAQISELELLP
ncbi:MAG TPA: ADP-ribosylglycohydrolase family protein, partial [Armatimonadota bacterium]